MKKKKLRTAIYPGSFDPITNGHLDVIKRACKIFDNVVIAVSVNVSKNPLFSLEERVKFISMATSNLSGIKIDVLDGLLVEFAKKISAQAVIRGLRAVSDFEYEFQMALMNRKLYPGLEVIFFMPSNKYAFLSSSLIKEVASLGGSVKEFVPPIVEEALLMKFRKEGDTNYYI